MAHSALIIVSKDKDFAIPLLEQAEAELGITGQWAENLEQAKAFMPSARLVVSSEGGKFALPAIIVKDRPVRMRHLLSDIETALKKATDDSLSIGKAYALKLRQGKLQHAASGKAVDVTDKEAQLLAHLAKAGKKGAPKEQLLKDVWGFDEALNTHTLETHIYRLRGKFKELAGDDSIITVSDGRYGLKA